MAILNTGSVELFQPFVSGRSSQDFRLNQAERQILFVSPRISCRGLATLRGTPHENVRGWELGFFQLQFIETNYFTYRGRTSAAGGAKISWSHNQICRDKHVTAPGFWYDEHIYKPAVERGVCRATAADEGGNHEMETGFVDEPEQRVGWTITNSTTGQPNYLHHADIAFHFCTMMVIRNPSNQYTVLKHFYWNVRWEAHFSPNATGIPQLVRRDHFDFNVQRNVHSGIPNDARFRNRVFDANLPIANKLANDPPRRQFSADWSIT